MGLFDIFQRKTTSKEQDVLAQAEAMLAETEEILADSQKIRDELDSLDPEQIRWVEWFTALPEGHKKVVEMCADNGVRVTPDNWAEVRAAIEEMSTD